MPLATMMLVQCFSDVSNQLLQRISNAASGFTKYEGKKSFVATNGFTNEMLKKHTYSTFPKTITVEIEILCSTV